MGGVPHTARMRQLMLLLWEEALRSWDPNFVGNPSDKHRFGCIFRDIPYPVRGKP